MDNYVTHTQKDLQTLTNKLINLYQTEHEEKLSKTHKQLRQTKEKDAERFNTEIEKLRQQTQLSAKANAAQIEHERLMAKQQLEKLNAIIDNHVQQVPKFKTTIMNLEKQLHQSETNNAENTETINILAQNTTAGIKHLQEQLEIKSKTIQHLQDDLDYKTKNYKYIMMRKNILKHILGQKTIKNYEKKKSQR